MLIQSLKLRNFKGCRSFTLEPQGNDCSIYGDNGTFKTTLADSWAWLLFDKDSLNRKDFEIKTLAPNGKPIHGLEHEVEGVIEVDGQNITLRKSYSEIWTKKRGSATKEFTGHTTNHFINDVPIKKGEYEARVYEIMDEQAFKLLTNPRYFADTLSWQDKRRLLLEVCGDNISDHDIIASDKALTPLTQILGQHNLDYYRKIITEKRRKINTELNLLPVRIAENALKSPTEENGTGSIDKAAISGQLQAQRAQLKAFGQEMATLEAGGGIGEKTIELRKAEAELLDIAQQHRGDQLEQVRPLGLQQHDLEVELLSLQRNSTELQNCNAKTEADLIELRQQFQMISTETLILTADEVCPTCQRPLPPEQIEQAKAKAQSDFNLDQAKRLGSIQAEGKRRRSHLDSSIAEITESEARIATLLPTIEELSQQIARITGAEVTTTPEYAIATLKVSNLKAEVIHLKEDTGDELAQLRERHSKCNQEIEQNEVLIARIQANEANRARVEELKNQERVLAGEYERLEKELFLTEQFTRIKVQLLEEKINSRFKMARFKLFEIQINGALSDVCQPMLNGVQYPDLNHGGKMAVGLDIISTLQTHFGIRIPVWVDNAESFCHLPKLDCQMIKLKVSAKDKALRVEKEDKMIDI